MAAASVMVGAGLIGAVAAPASALAPTNLKPAEALCTSHTGVFIPSVVQGTYACVDTEVSEAQLRAARALCERAYKQEFESGFLGTQMVPFYGCSVIL